MSMRNDDRSHWATNLEHALDIYRNDLCDTKRLLKFQKNGCAPSAGGCAQTLSCKIPKQLSGPEGDKREHRNPK